MKALPVTCLATVLLMGGCDLLAARYVDVSEEQGIREIVSTSRTTKTDLLFLGIDAYPSRKEVAYYVLVQPPGFEGPEILSRSVLPRGARLSVTGAQRCTNCSPRSVRLRVNVEGLARKEPVYIDMRSMGLLERR